MFQNEVFEVIIYMINDFKFLGVSWLLLLLLFVFSTEIQVTVERLKPCDDTALKAEGFFFVY